MINKVPVLGKAIIKNPTLRGVLNRVHNIYLKKIGNQVVAPNLKMGKTLSETENGLIND